MKIHLPEFPLSMLPSKNVLPFLFLCVASSAPTMLVAESTVKSKPVDVTAGIVEASLVTPKGAPFSRSKAADLPSLEQAGFATEPAFQDDFSPDWDPVSAGWRVATWRQNKTQMSPERSAVDGQGYLVQTVLAGEPARGGAVQTSREFGWGRWVARIKTSDVPGAINTMFTKDWDDLTTSESQSDGNKGEVDLEFLTYTSGKGTGEVHLAIHLKDRTPLWHLDIPLDFSPAEDFHEWGFDILPDRVVWHVDGKVIHTWKYTESERIDPNYEFFFNSWTQEKWIQGPPKTDAKYQIDWVRFYPLKSQ
jgi:beta-glucanase (GH16 family)